jgi:hypothetical protein
MEEHLDVTRRLDRRLGNEVSTLQNALEDLMLVPGNVDDVYLRLLWPRDEQGFADEGVYGPCLPRS